MVGCRAPAASDSAIDANAQTGQLKRPIIQEWPRAGCVPNPLLDGGIMYGVSRSQAENVPKRTETVPRTLRRLRTA